jgi:CDP-glycerol glycerophosphotransferase
MILDIPRSFMIAWQVAFVVARQHEKQGRWLEAAEGYRRIVEDGRPDDPKALFRLGHAYFRLDRIDDAVPYVQRAVSLSPGEAQWQYRLGFLLERTKEYETALTHYDAALRSEPMNERWLHRRRACAAAFSRQVRSASLLQEASEANPQDKEAVSKLAAHFRRNDLRWQEIECLLQGLQRFPDIHDWHQHLGNAYDYMGQHISAAQHYKAAAAHTRDALAHFGAAYASERAGLSEDAADEYATAIQFDKKLRASEFGVGVFFQARGLWPEAARHYEAQSVLHPENAELRFRLGMSYDRLYEWASAAAAYEAAVEIDPSRPYWFYRLGFVYERAGKLSEAVASYEMATTFKSKNKSLWTYRLGYCLAKMGKLEEACLAFIESEPLEGEELRALAKHPSRRPADGTNRRLTRYLRRATPGTRSAAVHQVHTAASALGDWTNLAEAHRTLADSTDEFDKSVYFDLGFAEFKAGRLREAVDAFLEMRPIRDSHGVNADGYMKDAGLFEVMRYTEYSEHLPIRHDVILYESSHGSSVHCNPLAIFLEVAARPEFALLKHVWVCNDLNRVPKPVQEHAGVIFVRKDSDLYLRYLASARYLINNTSFPTYFLRRPEQQYLNTWHGTPLKTLGKDVKTGFFEHRNIARNLLQTTHIIVPNVHTRNALIEAHDIHGLYPGKVALTGYPRADSVVNATSRDHARIRAELGLDPEDQRPVVLFAPTWRGGVGSSYFDAEGLKEDLQKLRGEDRHVFLRAHRFAEAAIADFGLDAFIVPEHIDTNELLTGVDVLVTDYSSIFFDFLPTRRTILFYAPDLEQYQRDRGLYFEMHSLPGVLTTGIDALARELSRALQSPEPPSADFQSEFSPKDDGRSAARTVDFFFKSDDTHVLPDAEPLKTNLLFHQSMIPNGIAASFVNLMKNLDTSRYRAVLLFDANAVAREPARMNFLRKLPGHVQLLARSGRQSFTAEEKWLDGKFAALNQLANAEQYEIAGRAYQRELARLTGTAKFEYSCEFDGYSRFWTAMFAHGEAPGQKRVIYLHNQMISEQKMKYPNLQGVFNLYDKFDALISVSESVNASNTTEIAEQYGIEPSRFSYANNPVDPDTCLQLSQEPLPPSVSHWLRPNATVFVTVGRLSPEKGHERLIRAFREECASDPDNQLVLVGDGPLKGSLASLIAGLGLQDNVLLLGALDNPFAVVKRADCFVLPSLHEGQGLVLLEALILGKTVIATDISGPRSVLSSGEGLLVENSQDGISHGLRLFLEGRIEVSPFDVKEYQRRAIASFNSVFVSKEDPPGPGPADAFRPISTAGVVPARS